MYKKFGVIQELRCILLFNTKLINNPQVLFSGVKISKKTEIFFNKTRTLSNIND